MSRIVQFLTQKSTSPYGDLKSLVPIFFLVGVGIESFMLSTGFYQLRTTREGLRKAARKAEFEESKEKIALYFLRNNYGMNVQSDYISNMRREQIEREAREKAQREAQQQSKK